MNKVVARVLSGSSSYLRCFLLALAAVLFLAACGGGGGGATSSSFTSAGNDDVSGGGGSGTTRSSSEDSTRGADDIADKAKDSTKNSYQTELTQNYKVIAKDGDDHSVTVEVVRNIEVVVKIAGTPGAPDKSDGGDRGVGGSRSSGADGVKRVTQNVKVTVVVKREDATKKDVLKDKIQAALDDLNERQQEAKVTVKDKEGNDKVAKVPLSDETRSEGKGGK